MKTLYTAELAGPITYTGAELSPHWIARSTGVFASSIVAFRGPCSVSTAEMVDMQDRLANANIRAAEMLHFLGEWFDGTLELAVARQRLLIAGFAEQLRRHLPAARAAQVLRRGNDLYLSSADLRDDGALHRESLAKLSVSIVTSSPVSTLFHFGVNIDPQGAPVRAIGLAELGVDPDTLAREVLSAWNNEWESMAVARCKVAPR